MSYSGNMILNYALRSTATPPPPTPWLALFIEGPGNTVQEVSGGGYARVNVTGVFAAPAPDDTIFNSLTISFPTPTAAWGKVLGGAIFDAPEDGNVLMALKLDVPVEIPAGPPVYFNPGTLRFGIETIEVS